MSIKAIRFNDESVRAIIAKKKTQTRIVNKKAVDMKAYKVERQSANKWNFYIQYGGIVDVIYPIESPVSAGDILWVQETFGRMPYGFVYRADGDSPEGWDRYDRWQSPIHIPREAVRIFLRVTDVRAEQLQDIDDDGVVAEGLEIGAQIDEIWNRTLSKSNRAKFGWDANPWTWVITFERCEKPVGWLEAI